MQRQHSSQACAANLLSVLCSTSLLLCRALSNDALHDFALSAVALPFAPVPAEDGRCEILLLEILLSSAEANV